MEIGGCDVIGEGVHPIVGGATPPRVCFSPPRVVRCPANRSASGQEAGGEGTVSDIGISMSGEKGQCNAGRLPVQHSPIIEYALGDGAGDRLVSFHQKDS